MPSVAEILRDSGFSDQEITALDQRAMTAFTGVLSTATAERERAELERRSNADFYDHQIVPALTGWDEERTRLENEKATAAAQAAFYKTQNEAARTSGFIPADAPGFVNRDQGGRYVAGAPGGTPGSPVFQPQELLKRAGDGLAMIADIDWKYRSLFDGKPMPVSPTELIRQADARRLDPMTYADQAFGFAQREKELAEQKQKAHDDAIRKETTEQRDRVWAERVGSNPDVRQPQENVRMSEVARAVKTGSRPDPLMMNEAQRRQETRAAIRTDVLEQQS